MHWHSLVIYMDAVYVASYVTTSIAIEFSMYNNNITN